MTLGLSGAPRHAKRRRWPTGRNAVGVWVVLSQMAIVLCSLAGRYVSDLDVVNHFAPALLVVTIACSIAYAAVKAHRVAMALLACGLVWGARLAPDALAAARSEPAPASEVLTVIQFNASVRNVDPEASAAWVLSQRPDVIFLQEVGGEGEQVFRRLAQAYATPQPCLERARRCSSVVLTRHTLETGDRTGRRPLWLSGGYARIRTPQGPLLAIAFHTTWPLPGARHEAQTREAADVIGGFPKDDMIVAGDFNSTPWSHAVALQDRLFGLQRVTHALPSWPARFGEREFPLPVMPIDHVYVGANWRVVDVQRGPRLGSDHYPIIAHIARKPSWSLASELALAIKLCFGLQK